MAINGSPIPNGYDNTYDTAEVSRPDMDRRANWAEENPEAPQYIRNKEEGGSSGGGGTLKLNIVGKAIGDGDITYTYDHTWQEVHDALEGGINVIYQTVEDYEDYEDEVIVPARYLRVLNTEILENEGETAWRVFAEVLSDDPTPSLIVGLIAGADSADSPIKIVRWK